MGQMIFLIKIIGHNNWTKFLAKRIAKCYYPTVIYKEKDHESFCYWDRLCRAC